MLRFLRKSLLRETIIEMLLAEGEICRFNQIFKLLIGRISLLPTSTTLNLFIDLVRKCEKAVGAFL